MPLRRLITDAQVLGFILFAGSAAALSAAYAAQYVAGMAPCELCLWQRIPYWIALPASLALMATAPRTVQGRELGSLRWAAGLAALCFVLFLVDSGIATFHVGVERGWWEGTSSCALDLTGITTAEEMRRAIENAPLARCTDVSWMLFGVSITIWNAIYALVLAIMALAGTVSLLLTWKRARAPRTGSRYGSHNR